MIDVGTFLHLVRGDSLPLAVKVIAAQCQQGAVTVVLLDEAPDPDLPEGVTVRRLRDGDLDYAALLGLMFAADHVVAW